MENYFSNVKTGDEVFHIIYEWGTVIKTANDSFMARFINRENTLVDLSFWSDGRQFLSDKNPSVFWNEIKIIPLPKPKRKAEKIIEGWINIYGIESSTAGYLYATKEQADMHTSPAGNRLGEACHVVHKYTIEE